MRSECSMRGGRNGERVLSKKAAARGRRRSGKEERARERERRERATRGFVREHGERNGSRERDRDVEEAEFRSLKDLAVGSRAPAPLRYPRKRTCLHKRVSMIRRCALVYVCARIRARALLAPGRKHGGEEGGGRIRHAVHTRYIDLECEFNLRASNFHSPLGRGPARRARRRQPSRQSRPLRL